MDKHNESKPSGPETYIPSHEQEEMARELLSITEKCEKHRIKYVVGGGYGLDGLYGSLTREHNDIDLIIDDRDISNALELAEGLGYEKDETEPDENKFVYKKQIPGNTVKLEIAPSSLLARYADGDITGFFPEQPNAHIKAHTFKAIPLEGVKRIIEIQNQRAREQNWREYPPEKRLNQNEIIKKLQNRQ